MSTEQIKEIVKQMFRDGDEKIICSEVSLDNVVNFINVH